MISKKSESKKLDITGEGVFATKNRQPDFDTWQKDAVSKWKVNGYRGIVDAVTATGKTYMAFKAIESLPVDTVVSIVVPNTNLMHQWKADMVKHGFPADIIGLRGGGKKEIGKRITIYVINSARTILPILDFSIFENMTGHLLLVDEVHTSGSVENRKIYDCHYDFVLGISATSKRENDFFTTTVIIPNVGDVIKTYGYGDAQRDNVIADFKVINYGIELTLGEKQEYDMHTKRLSKLHPILVERYPGLRRGHFFTVLQGILKNQKGSYNKSDNDIFEYLEHARERKDLVYGAKNRVESVMQLLAKNEGKKILISHERVEWLYTLRDRLKGKYLVGIYEGKMKAKAKREILSDFNKGKLNILLYAKALTMGMNVPDIDIGIIASATASLIQRIQSIGRVIRRSGDKKALVYTLFAKDTTDVKILNKSMKSGKIPKANMMTVDWSTDEKVDLGDSARKPLYDSNPKWKGEYKGKYLGMEFSVDTRCKIFKKVKGNRHYFVGSDWGIGSKVMTVKRTGGKFRINPAGHIITFIGKKLIYCGSTDRMSDLENGEYKGPRDMSKPLTEKENNEMLDWLTGFKKRH